MHKQNIGKKLNQAMSEEIIDIAVNHPMNFLSALSDMETDCRRQGLLAGMGLSLLAVVVAFLIVFLFR